jgi:hypothetical protein
MFGVLMVAAIGSDLGVSPCNTQRASDTASAVATFPLQGAQTT